MFSGIWLWRIIKMNVLYFKEWHMLQSVSCNLLLPSSLTLKIWQNISICAHNCLNRTSDWRSLAYWSCCIWSRILLWWDGNWIMPTCEYTWCNWPFLRHMQFYNNLLVVECLNVVSDPASLYVVMYLFEWSMVWYLAVQLMDLHIFPQWAL
jgi:hypothetical protein